MLNSVLACTRLALGELASPDVAFESGEMGSPTKNPGGKSISETRNQTINQSIGIDWLIPAASDTKKCQFLGEVEKVAFS